MRARSSGGLRTETVGERCVTTGMGSQAQNPVW